jgi:hypothetical protein
VQWKQDKWYLYENILTFYAISKQCDSYAMHVLCYLYCIILYTCYIFYTVLYYV